jgi:hypothetical protein
MSWLDEHIHVERPRWKQLLFDDGALPWVLVSLGLAVLWVLSYDVHGKQYTIDDTGPTPPHPEPRTVYYDPGNPYVSMLDSPLRLVEEGLFVALAAGSVVCLGTGVATGELRRRRRPTLVPQRHPSSDGDRLGSGRAR